MIFSTNDIPTPKDLAKKEATRTISLRVKEKTMLGFEKYAQIYGVTASSLINGLLDSYIEKMNKKDQESSSYEQKNSSASKKVMDQYLEKLAGRVGIANDEDLCYALASDLTYSNIESIDSTIYYNDVVQTKNNADFDYGNDLISVFMGDARSTEFMCVNGQKCNWVSKDTDEQHIIGVPASKYPIVGNMILGYTKKYDNLYPGQALKIDSITTKKLIEVINNTENRVELAKEIGWVLMTFERVQDE